MTRTQPDPDQGLPIQPAAAAGPAAWQGDVSWHSSASEAAEKLIRRNAQELRDEAERITRRADAVTVAPQYVRQASEHLGIHRSSGLGDVLLAIGSVLLGLTTGVGATLLLTPVHVKPTVIVVTSIVSLCGAAALAAGITLKLMKR